MPMRSKTMSQTLQYLPQFTTGKVIAIPTGLSRDLPDSLADWAARYLTLAVIGVRGANVVVVGQRALFFSSASSATNGFSQVRRCSSIGRAARTACVPSSLIAEANAHDGAITRRCLLPGAPTHASPSQCQWYCCA